MESSLNNNTFVLEALKKGHRIDGRGIYDHREISIKHEKTPGSVEVQLGKSRVHAVTTCQVVRPYPDRPAEGQLTITLELTSLCDPSFDTVANKQACTELEVMISRQLDKLVRQSRCLDLESLVLSVGEQVWQINLTVHVLDNDGNLADACLISAMASLKSFKRPEFSRVGDGPVVIHSTNERAPIPLSINYTPVLCTFSYFMDGSYLVLDPCLAEERFHSGSISIAINSNDEICYISKNGGVSLPIETVNLCTLVASEKAKHIIGLISQPQ
ncbi:Exosome complex component rrp45 [Smittium culicis]|uniref:Exosome complex component rrp45 n=2 Tax=Smittium culicis TaxID=133412 RepID=A0A1R1YF93_9FUNG|nr:Exosome complex component rrp45 [Smittium culicis]